METTQNGPGVDNQVTVNGVKQPPSKKHFKIRKPRRRSIVGVTGVAVLLVGLLAAGYLFVYKPANDYAIKVGSSVLPKSDYLQIAKEYKQSIDPSIKNDKELQQYIIETFKFREVAEEYGIEASSQAIEEYAKNYYGNDTVTLWQKIVAERQIYDTAMTSTSDGKKKVAYIAVPFSLHFASGQGAGPDGKDPDGYGDQQIIENDKKLAQERVAQYRGTLVGSPNTATAEKIIKEITGDKVLSYGITKNRSAIYDVDETGRVDYSNEFMNISIPESDVKAVFSLNGGATGILTETGKKYFSTIEGYDNDGVEIAYYFYADLTKANAVNTEAIINAKKEVKVDINV